MPGASDPPGTTPVAAPAVDEVGSDEPPSTGGPSAPAVFRRLLSTQRRLLMLAFAAAAVHLSTLVGVPLATRAAIDGIVGRHLAEVRTAALLLVVLALVRGLAAGVRHYLSIRLAAAVSVDLRQLMHAKVLQLHVGFHDDLGSGQILARCSSDVTIVEGMVAVVPFFTQAALLGVVGSVMLLTISPPLAALVVLVIAVSAGMALLLARPLYPASRSTQELIGRFGEFVEQQVAGARVVRGHGFEPESRRTGAALTAQICAAGIGLGRHRARFIAAFVAVPGLATVVVVGVGGTLGVQGQLTPGSLLAFVQYLGMLVIPVMVGAQLLSLWPQAAVASSRLMEILDAAPAIIDPIEPSRTPVGPVPIDINDVWFGYDPGKPVLRGLSLHVPAGTSCAVVGRTGAGKTTIAELLPRFQDVAAGSVRVGGIDVRELPVGALRELVASVFSESTLLSGSVTDNIAVTTAGSRERLADVARAVRVHDFAEHLPQGYDTLVGEDGSTLSGGQKQRVAIARALLRDPAVLILDDPTRGLDPTTSQQVIEALAVAMQDRTTLLFTNDVSLVRQADQVVLLEQGTASASGTHETLLALPGSRSALALDHHPGQLAG